MRTLTGFCVLLAACGGDVTTVATTPIDASIDGSHDDASLPDTSTAEDAAVTDTSVADTTPPWSPKSIMGLSLWLDAAKGVMADKNGLVSVWSDQSGNGNDAKQPISASQPITITKVVNGLPVVRFDGLGKQYITVADAPSLQWGTGDFAVYEVVAYKNTPSKSDNTGYAALWVKASPNYPFTGGALFGNEPAVPNGALRAQAAFTLYVDSSQTSYNDGKFHFVAMSRSGSALQIRADGALVGSVSMATADLSATGNPVFIGGRTESYATQSLAGDVAEIIAVKGQLAPSDLTSIEGYLKTKYAL